MQPYTFTPAKGLYIHANSFLEIPSGTCEVMSNVLLDRDGFGEAVRHIAAELAGRLAETTEYPETIGALRHLA